MTDRTFTILTTRAAVAAGLLLVLSGCAYERDRPPSAAPSMPVAADGGPAGLAALQSLTPATGEAEEDKKAGLRLDAMRDAATSFGMRGGLARRSWEIANSLDRHKSRLDRIFNFRPLAIPVSEGTGVIVPPIIEEAQDALAVSDDGQSATAARRVLRIVRPARLTTAPPDWRQYLIREWPEADMPSGMLLPRTDEERGAWEIWVSDGWAKGRWQADTTFQSDLSRLTRDFTGMLRYRSLVETGEVDTLYLAEADLGVTGGGDEMRVGDRVVRITEPVRLNSNTQEWAPIVIGMPPATSRSAADTPEGFDFLSDDAVHLIDDLMEE